MLTLDQCIGMSELSEEEIAVIAEHEHLPLILAAELGHTLLKTPKGVFTLRGYFHDALDKAKLSGKRDQVKRLDRLLSRFNAAHPTPRVL